MAETKPPKTGVLTERTGLRAWAYTSPEMFELELDMLFRRHWQIVCHVNDIPETGDFLTFDLAGERALVIRGRDGAVRAFHNLCRHRGSRVVADEKGTCRSAIVCPFHGWVYNLDGTLRGASRPDMLPELDPKQFGLKPLEFDIWHGFVFVRFQPGTQPKMSEILARFEAEIAPYDMGSLLPDGNGFAVEEIEANWKCVRDVDNEGYHVPMAHPGLEDLFGRNYFDEPWQEGTARSFSQFRDTGHRLWSVKNYTKLIPQVAALDTDHQRAWIYVGVFPSFVFGIYPDSVIMYQEVPVAPGRTLQRSVSYKRPNEDRQMRVARYLSGRIDRITAKEDEQLIEWCWEATFSSAYDGVILSDLEGGVRQYHDLLRKFFPVLDGPEPEPGNLAARNAELLGEVSVDQ